VTRRLKNIWRSRFKKKGETTHHCCNTSPARIVEANQHFPGDETAIIVHLVLIEYPSVTDHLLLIVRKRLKTHTGQHRCSQGGPGDHARPRFLAYLVILCFEKRRPKQKYRCSLKVKHFVPQQFWGWLRHCMTTPNAPQKRWNQSQALRASVVPLRYAWPILDTLE